MPINNPKFLVYVTVDEPDVEDQSMSRPAQDLAHDVFEGLYNYFGIYPESEEGPYQYDWAQLRNSSAELDSARGESFIEDPDGTIVWLEADALPDLPEQPEEEEDYMPNDGSVSAEED